MCPQYFPLLRSLIVTLQCPHVHIFLNPNIEKLYLVRRVWNALFGCSHGYTYAMALAFTTSTVAKELWESLSETAAAASPRHELRKKLRRSVGGGCVFAALDTLALRPHSPNISWNSCNDERLRLIWSRGLRPLFQFLAASPTFNCRSCTVI